MRSIAIIGASSDRTKYSNKAVRAYLEKGYTVFPVNPKETSIEGQICYASLKDIKKEVNVVSLYVNPSIGEKLIEEIINADPDELFLNPGTESDKIESECSKHDIKVRKECSIRALGIDPAIL